MTFEPKNENGKDRDRERNFRNRQTGRRMGRTVRRHGKKIFPSVKRVREVRGTSGKQYDSDDVNQV